MRADERKHMILSFHLLGFSVSNEDDFCALEYCMRAPMVAMATDNSTAADLMRQNIANQISYALLHIHFPFKTADVVT